MLWVHRLSSDILENVGNVFGAVEWPPYRSNVTRLKFHLARWCLQNTPWTAASCNTSVYEKRTGRVHVSRVRVVDVESDNLFAVRLTSSLTMRVTKYWYSCTNEFPFCRSLSCVEVVCICLKAVDSCDSLFKAVSHLQTGLLTVYSLRHSVGRS